MIFRNKHLLAIKGILFKFPAVLINYIADIFGHGWDRNRAIDSIGNHGNALMGGYLLAPSNLTISISGLLTTDTLVSLTDSGLVGNISSNGVISFTEGLNYGAFEVYRGAVLIGRFCLTERQGSRLINQVTGTLGNGLLGGTLTTVWQRSNAFYSETNVSGYSISETGWVTDNGEAIDVGTLIPADLVNVTKCMAYVEGVQQDLQFVGKAQNSISVVPTAFFCNQDRIWNIGNVPTTITTYTLEIACVVYFVPGYNCLYGGGNNNGESPVVIFYSYKLSFWLGNKEIFITTNVNYFGVPVTIKAEYTQTYWYLSITNRLTNTSITNITYSTNSPYTLTSTSQSLCSWRSRSYRFKGIFCALRENINNIPTRYIVTNPHNNDVIDTIKKVNYPVDGITTNITQNVDLVYNTFNQTGYELWYNGTDYQIYPIASDGTTIITPSGYTSQGIVTAGNMPSVADARFTTFRYALANSYEVRKQVPEAYNTDAQSTPKLLTYNELNDLENNHKIRITESDNKITNLKILQ